MSRDEPSHSKRLRLGWSLALPECGDTGSLDGSGGAANIVVVAGVAQLVERNLPKVDVESSNLFARFFPFLQPSCVETSRFFRVPREGGFLPLGVLINAGVCSTFLAANRGLAGGVR